MDESYWKFVEPIWDAVSIYDGETLFLDQFSKLTEKEKTLFSAHWAQSEIMNGGLRQFFSNSTGILAPEAVSAFLKLGMPKSAEAIKQAMHFFGEPYPRDRAARQNKLEDFFDKYDEDAIPMEEQEDLIAVAIEDENGGFENAANSYSKKC